MAKFKNVITGNIVSTNNKDTIALMEKSENYVAVKNGRSNNNANANNANANNANANGNQAE